MNTQSGLVFAKNVVTELLGPDGWWGLGVTMAVNMSGVLRRTRITHRISFSLSFQRSVILQVRHTSDANRVAVGGNGLKSA